jgi:hypothetical protein
MKRDLAKAGPADMVLHRQIDRRVIRGFRRETQPTTTDFPVRLASRSSGAGIEQFGGGLPVMLKRLGRMQTTLRRQTALSGVGVHSGEMVHLTLLPADAGCGVTFTRTDLEDGGAIPVRLDDRSFDTPGDERRVDIDGRAPHGGVVGA